mgnify:CR=1 FL=1
MTDDTPLSLGSTSNSPETNFSPLADLRSISTVALDVPLYEKVAIPLPFEIVLFASEVELIVIEPSEPDSIDTFVPSLRYVEPSGSLVIDPVIPFVIPAVPCTINLFCS